MPKEESVNVLDSLDGEEEDKTPAGEGKSQEDPSSGKKKDDRPEINRVMEENRKLREEVDELKSTMEERISQLQEKEKLTKGEAKELDNLEAQVDALRRNPDAKAWIELQKRLVREELDKQEQKRLEKFVKEDQARALEWVEMRAGELKMDEEKLKGYLLEILEGGRWGGDAPTVRVKKAFDQWKKVQDQIEKAKEKAPGEFVEGEGRAQRATTLTTELKDASKSGNWRGVLGKIAEAQTKAV